MAARHSHCSFCGAPFAEAQPWPRVCAVCGNTSYLNPLPVAVLLVPVDRGVLVVRRGVAPRRGELALPGGFIEQGESWQAAAAREVFEEAGVVIDPAEVRDLYARSAPDGTLLVFGVAAPRALADLPPFAPSVEATERAVINEPIELAFPLHTEAVSAFFATRDNGQGGFQTRP